MAYCEYVVELSRATRQIPVSPYFVLEPASTRSIGLPESKVSLQCIGSEAGRLRSLSKQHDARNPLTVKRQRHRPDPFMSEPPDRIGLLENHVGTSQLTASSFLR